MSRNLSKKKNITGELGEDIAVEYLVRHGHQVVERNYRQLRGEIDIITRHKQTVVFTEVKTRRSTSFGYPEEAVTKAKQKQISIVAQHYLCNNDLDDCECRFDVVTILLIEGQPPQINHIENAFDSRL